MVGPCDVSRCSDRISLFGQPSAAVRRTSQPRTRLAEHRTVQHVYMFVLLHVCCRCFVVGTWIILAKARVRSRRASHRSTTTSDHHQSRILNRLSIIRYQHSHRLQAYRYAAGHEANVYIECSAHDDRNWSTCGGPPLFKICGYDTACAYPLCQSDLYPRPKLDVWIPCVDSSVHGLYGTDEWCRQMRTLPSSQRL